MDFNKFFQSKTFKKIIICLGILIAALLIFKAGVFVGFKKADFSYRWGENYHRNFAGPRGGFFNDFKERDFIGAHGVFGQVIKIDPSTSSGQAATIVIKGQDNVEKIVLVGDNTVITRFRDTIKLADLKTDENVVVIGEPNNGGQIEAKFIRVMPPMPKEESLRFPPPRMFN